MSAQPPKDADGTIAVDTHFIPTVDDPSLRLHLRNKRPAGVARFEADRIVLFVHGATYPSETGFDQPLPGGSWMDYVAARGYDAWCLDVRGCGRSTRPPAMHAPAEANPPVLRTPNGVVKDVVEHWARGHARYDPADIRVPTLVVVGEWDRDTPPRMAQSVHARLVNAPSRERVVLPEGTHSIVLETRRLSLLETVRRFLEAQAALKAWLLARSWRPARMETDR